MPWKHVFRSQPGSPPRAFPPHLPSSPPPRPRPVCGVVRPSLPGPPSWALKGPQSTITCTQGCGVPGTGCLPAEKALVSSASSEEHYSHFGLNSSWLAYHSCRLTGPASLPPWFNSHRELAGGATTEPVLGMGKQRSAGSSGTRRQKLPRFSHFWGPGTLATCRVYVSRSSPGLGSPEAVLGPVGEVILGAAGSRWSACPVPVPTGQLPGLPSYSPLPGTSPSEPAPTATSLAHFSGSCPPARDPQRSGKAVPAVELAWPPLSRRSPRSRGPPAVAASSARQPVTACTSPAEASRGRLPPPGEGLMAPSHPQEDWC